MVVCASLGLAYGCAAHGTQSPGFAGDDAGPDAGPAPDAELNQNNGPDGSILAGCATATAPIERDPIYMLMVLDGSSSMKDDYKWAAIVPALEGFFDNLAARQDTSFGLGLTVFSDTQDPTAGKGPYDTMDVPIGFVDTLQVERLKGRLDIAHPFGDTPTYAVLSGQYPLLEQYKPTPPLLTANARKVLVLMTDGVPYPNTDTQKPQVIQAAKDEFGKSVTTFAVGIGVTFPLDPQVYDPLFMAQVALAGGAPNQPCDPNETQFDSNMCHFQVTPVQGAQDPLVLEQAMRVAFDKIRSKVTSCDLTLVKTGPVDPDLVNVVFTDASYTQQIVPKDPVNGWTYDDPNNPTKILLHGDACTELKANPSGEVQVVLGCRTIVK
jgi:hypothetical protein